MAQRVAFPRFTFGETIKIHRGNADPNDYPNDRFLQNMPPGSLLIIDAIIDPVTCREECACGMFMKCSPVNCETPVWREILAIETCAENAPLDPTVANDDTFDALTEGVAVAVNVTTNDVPSLAVASVAIQTGALPAGLAMDSLGAITGTPTVNGAFAFTYLLTSTSGSTDTASVSMTVAAA